MQLICKPGFEHIQAPSQYNRYFQSIYCASGTAGLTEVTEETTVPALTDFPGLWGACVLSGHALAGRDKQEKDGFPGL